ncbi:putative receptor-like protein kinase At5g39000 [Primulina eburnea]|uniref:putative receptor-like protein kinase At5g39000 n=1 Tax=Primulina eburnea TaxID=1245227 RepID=UPI003C6BE8CC
MNRNVKDCCCSIYLLLFICFSIGSTDCIEDPALYMITGDVSISCGSNGVSAVRNGRKWIGDEHPKLNYSLQLKGTSTISSVSISDDQAPYKAARISGSAFSYSFLLNPGQKFIRLHFNPTAYKGFETRTDLFDVVAGPFVLLGNFSASLTSEALGLSYFTKEYCLNVEENQLLNISFSPVTSRLKDAYAFINGIEIIPVTAEHSYFHGGNIGARVIGHESQLFYIDNGTALEMVHREKFSGDSASPDDDFSDIFGMAPKEKTRVLNRKIPVHVGFRYLVRLQFSNGGLKMIENGKLIFKVLINEIVACTNIDIFQETDNIVFLEHNHRDFIVIMRGGKEEGKRDLSLQSYDEFINGSGFFAGFEIFKLSNLDNCLDCPNPLPFTRVSPSWTIQSLLSISLVEVLFQPVAIAMVFLVNITSYKLRGVLQSNTKEESKLSTEESKLSDRAGRSCRRFSLNEIQLGTSDFSDALVIGKGGYGKVYKCLIDGGRDTVAIKRLKSSSKQGASEFLAEVETLSELRHVNLVSLIGYCTDHGEMILVYSYMPNGNLADHLYKLERNGNNSSSLSWKQRLDICIGACRGLDYLHTGHGVIHRDVKVSNILLDGNFTAKISDLGLVKHEDKSNGKSHASTKVKGTFGYIDPSYLSTGKLTRKSDVYAFGVVLLEVLCGRPVLDQSISMDAHNLTKWARDKISKGEVDLIVASSLRGEILPDSLKTFVQVVGRCLDDEPKKRPTLAQVVVQLEIALEQQETPRSLTSNEITSVAPHHDEANTLVNGRRTSSSSNGQTISSHPREQTRRNDGANVLVSGPLTSTFSSEQTITPHPRKKTSRNGEANDLASRRPTSSSTSVQTMISHGRVRPGHNDAANVFHSWQLTLSSPSRVSTPLPRAQSTRDMDNGYPSSEGNQRNTPAYRPLFRQSLKAFMNRFKSPKIKKLPIPGAGLHKFDWNIIASATNQFAQSYKIGQGGFGSVYKAVLPSGETVAVKRLSTHSARGLIQFENEIRLLHNLKHINIIKLLGYCDDGEERILVYEFMENGGLDAFIFDEARRIQLQWNYRLKIIMGIARGLRYLHQDLGERIIHRDPKPSNILLDSQMNPRISDFGLAMSLQEDRSFLSTAVAGTPGYIAPEYMMGGGLSTTADVYTFGISVLEIVSGKRNIDLRREDGEDAPMLGFGWRPWEDGKILNLADKSIHFDVDEALRCIQVGILCTREAHERPTMSDVVDMLEGKKFPTTRTKI